MVRVINNAQLSVPVQCQTDPDGHNAVWIYGDSTYPIHFETSLSNSGGIEGTISPQSISGENISQHYELHDRDNSRQRLNVDPHGNRRILICVLLAIVLLIFLFLLSLLLRFC